MNGGFYSANGRKGWPASLVLLMAIFFCIPLLLRTASQALHHNARTTSQEFGWLPQSSPAAEKWQWFQRYFGEQSSITLTISGCEEDSDTPNILLAKLQQDSADDGLAVDREHLDQFLGDLQLFVGDDSFYNCGGQQEKWLVDASGNQYYITPNGRLYRWNGASILQTIRQFFAREDVYRQLDGTFIASLDDSNGSNSSSRYWENPRLFATPFFKSVEVAPAVTQLQGTASSIVGQSDSSMRTSPTEMRIQLSDAAFRSPQLVFSSGLWGHPRGRVWTIAEQCGLTIRANSFWDLSSILPSGLRAEEIEKPNLQVSGFIWQNVQIEEEGKLALTRLLAFALTFGLLINYVFLRSLRLTLMASTVSLVAVAFSLCWIWWSETKIDSFSMFMPPIVFVLASTISIHFMKQYRTAAESHECDQRSNQATDRATYWSIVPNFLSAFTIVAAMALLTTCKVATVRNFGLLTAVSLLLTLVFSYLFLPSCLKLFPVSDRRLGFKRSVYFRSQSFAKLFVDSLMDERRTIGLAILVASLVLAFGIARTKLSSRLSELAPESRQAKLMADSLRTLGMERASLDSLDLVVRFPYSMLGASSVRNIQSGQSLVAVNGIDLRAELFSERHQRADLVRQIERTLREQLGRNIGLQSESSANNHQQAEVGMSIGTAIADEQVNQFITSTFSALSTQTPKLTPDNVLRLVGSHEAAAVTSKPKVPVLDSRFYAVEAAGATDGAELWRINVQLMEQVSSLSNHNVDKIRNIVGPIVDSCNAHWSIQRSAKATNQSRSTSLVLLLGIDQESAGALHDVDGVAAVVDGRSKSFLDSLLRRLTDDGHLRVQWHSPQRQPLGDGRSTSQQWASYLGKFDCVVLALPHADYDLDFIQKNSQSFIDLSEYCMDTQDQLPLQVNSRAQAIGVASVSGPDDPRKAAEQIELVITGPKEVLHTAGPGVMLAILISFLADVALMGVVLSGFISPARTLFSSGSPRYFMRGIACSLIAVFPTFFALAVVVGLMGFRGFEFDITILTALFIAASLATADGLHFAIEFRTQLRLRLDVRSATEATFSGLATTMLHSKLIACMAFAALAASGHPPIRSMAQAFLAIMILSSLMEIVALPAILSSRLGRLFTGHVNQRPRNLSLSGLPDVEYQLSQSAPESKSSPFIQQRIDEATQLLSAPKFLEQRRNAPVREHD